MIDIIRSMETVLLLRMARYHKMASGKMLTLQIVPIVVKHNLGQIDVSCSSGKLDTCRMMVAMTKAVPSMVSPAVDEIVTLPLFHLMM